MDFKVVMFEVKKTVASYKSESGKSDVTIRRWIAEGKLLAHKDPGGRDWLIVGEKIPNNPDSVEIFVLGAT